EPLGRFRRVLRAQAERHRRRDDQSCHVLAGQSSDGERVSIALEQLHDGTTVDRNFQALASAVNPPLPQARVYNSAAISIANNTTTALTFDSERYDNGGLHSASANTDRLTVPITGLYAFGACIQWASNATGIRLFALTVNGTTVVEDLRAPMSGI